jgi:steroid delta-isomerase-like uncharacterized protein
MGTDLFDGWLSAWNNHDAAALGLLMTEDGIYEIKPTGRILTRATIEKTFLDRHAMSSDLSFEYPSTQQDGEWYSAEWRAVGTHDGPLVAFDLAPTGKSFTIEGASIGLREGNKIKRHTEYWDLRSLLAQLGVPQPPSVDWGLARLPFADNQIESE